MSIEDRISKLKAQTDEYSKLPEHIKIQNIDNYNRLVHEKDECIEIIESYKLMLESDVEMADPDSTIISDDEFMVRMNDINKIKSIIERPNVQIEELCILTQTLAKYKCQVQKYIESKKMSVQYI